VQARCPGSHAVPDITFALAVNNAASFLLSHFSIIAFDTYFADETSDLLYKTTLQIKFYYFLRTQISIA